MCSPEFSGPQCYHDTVLDDASRSVKPPNYIALPLHLRGFTRTVLPGLNRGRYRTSQTSPPPLVRSPALICPGLVGRLRLSQHLVDVLRTLIDAATTSTGVNSAECVMAILEEARRVAGPLTSG